MHIIAVRRNVLLVYVKEYENIPKFYTQLSVHTPTTFRKNALSSSV